MLFFSLKKNYIAKFYIKKYCDLKDAKNQLSDPVDLNQKIWKNLNFFFFIFHFLKNITGM